MQHGQSHLISSIRHPSRSLKPHGMECFAARPRTGPSRTLQRPHTREMGIVSKGGLAQIDRPQGDLNRERRCLFWKAEPRYIQQSPRSMRAAGAHWPSVYTSVFQEASLFVQDGRCPFSPFDSVAFQRNGPHQPTPGACNEWIRPSRT